MYFLTVIRVKPQKRKNSLFSSIWYGINCSFAFNDIQNVFTNIKLYYNSFDCPFDYRNIGYFKTLEQAEESVLNNYSNIFESYYQYAIIEKIEEGLSYLYFDREFHTYKWLDGKYKKVDNECELIKMIKEYKFLGFVFN